MNDLAVALDAAILLWLVFTWFYEGHHKRCKVEAICPVCKHDSIIDCCATKEKGDEHRSR
jgi:hypothetical protein